MMHFPFCSMVFAVSLALAPSDRMQMADKMFAKGLYAEAAKEYAALKGGKGVLADEIAFRIAECNMMTGREKEALATYDTLVLRDVPVPLKAASLYRLACAKNDVALFLRCEQVDPSGRYASLSRLKRAKLVATGKSAAGAAQRREATGILLDLCASPDKSIAEEALFTAAQLAYSDRRWNESAILFGRLIKSFPDGQRAKAAAAPYAWSLYFLKRYTQCMSICGDSRDDELFYLRAISLLALDRKEQGLAELSKYIEAHPRGRNRNAAERPVQLERYNAAMKNGDAAGAVQAAKLLCDLSDTPEDALRLAWAHEKALSPEKARMQYRKIAKKWPDSPAAGEALFSDAFAYLREKNWNAADLALEEVLRRFPDYPRKNEALYWRGIAAIHLGHSAEGAIRLEEALKAGLSLDQSREANLLIADFEARSGKTEDAAKRFAKLLETGAAERMSATQIAAVLKLLVRQSLWEPVLAGARSLSARSSDLSFRQISASYEGMSLEGLARFDEAIAAYRKALAVNADTSEGAAAALALGHLEFRKGEFAAAEKTLADAIARNSGPEGLKARARAYRILADVSRAQGDSLKAKGYETVLKELFGEEL